MLISLTNLGAGAIPAMSERAWLFHIGKGSAGGDCGAGVAFLGINYMALQSFGH